MIIIHVFDLKIIRIVNMKLLKNKDFELYTKKIINKK